MSGWHPVSKNRFQKPRVSHPLLARICQYEGKILTIATPCYNPEWVTHTSVPISLVSWWIYDNLCSSKSNLRIQWMLLPQRFPLVSADDPSGGRKITKARGRCPPHSPRLDSGGPKSNLLEDSHSGPGPHPPWESDCTCVSGDRKCAKCVRWLQT